METAEDHGPAVLIFPPVLFGLTLVTGIVLTWLFPFHFWEATWSRRILGAVLNSDEAASKQRNCFTRD